MRARSPILPQPCTKGSIYKCTYQGQNALETVEPFLRNAKFSNPQDAQRMLGLCFALDRKFVLRNLPTSCAENNFVVKYDLPLDLDSHVNDGKAFAGENIGGGVVLWPVFEKHKRVHPDEPLDFSGHDLMVSTG